MKLIQVHIRTSQVSVTLEPWTGSMLEPKRVLEHKSRKIFLHHTTQEEINNIQVKGIKKSKLSRLSQ